MFLEKFSLRSLGFKKPVDDQGSSITAIGVGLFVAFGGVLFGSASNLYTPLFLTNERADMTQEQLVALLPCQNG
jgi:hypothetical protein